MILLNFFKLFFILFFTYEIYANDTIDNKVKQLTLELRCMTCQNQSVYDSDSEYSKDIKKFVKEKFDEGLSEKQIKDLLTKRYGEYILFKPYFNTKNLLLWLFPFILVIVCLLFLVMYSKKSTTK